MLAEKEETALLSDIELQQQQNDLALLLLVESIRERHLWRPWRALPSEQVEELKELKFKYDS